MAANAAEKAPIDRLSTRGFTVNGDLAVWSLYVVEHEYAPPPQGKPKRGWLYVGQTKCGVATRLATNPVVECGDFHHVTFREKTRQERHPKAPLLP